MKCNLTYSYCPDCGERYFYGGNHNDRGMCERCYKKQTPIFIRVPKFILKVIAFPVILFWKGLKFVGGKIKNIWVEVFD